MRQNKRHLPKFLRKYDKDDNDWLDEREIQATPKGELGKNTKKTAYLLILGSVSRDNCFGQFRINQVETALLASAIVATAISPVRNLCSRH